MTRIQAPIAAPMHVSLARFLFFIGSVLTTLPNSSIAGVYGEAFLRELTAIESSNSARSGGEANLPVATLEGILFLSDPIDIAALESEMHDADIRTRWRRHEFVIEAAQDHCRRSQSSLLRALDEGVARGQIHRYQPFWAVNAVCVEATPRGFDSVVDRGDIQVIRINPSVELRSSGVIEPSTPRGDSEIENGLLAVRADVAWEKGYTGEGILVGHFDGGVDGAHEAFADRWRGATEGVEWWEAWYDPYGQTEFPIDLSGSHGTHTMGLLVANPPNEPPLGIAYDATWISSGALIEYNVAKIISAFEWVADPDGDPSTVDDVPSVVNHSWGTSALCNDEYWMAIDLIEAAGIVNVIAADNSGPSPMSVKSPESRAETPYTNFCVGGINAHDESLPVRRSSGRGPSPCDSISIKPEVVAPAFAIRSTTNNDGYGNNIGNSMAAPHVSGAFALLCQVDPGLTVDQYKDAIMRTALDLGEPGEDNSYGWGLIDIGAAVEWVETHFVAHPPAIELTGPSLPAEFAILNWHPPRNPPEEVFIVQYRVYRAPMEGSFPKEPVATVAPFPTTYWDREVDSDSRYLVTAVYSDGEESEPTGEVSVVFDPGRNIRSEAPSSEPAVILVAAPNPMARSTEMRYRCIRDETVRLEIFDAAGTLVRTVVDRRASAGTHRATWNGRDENGLTVGSGTYFARLRTETGTLSEKILVLR